MLPEIEEIARRRKALGITQNDLARETELSRSLIAKVERGIVSPNYVNAKKIFSKLEEKEKTKRSDLQRRLLGEICSTMVEYTVPEESIIDVEIRMAAKALSQLPVKTSDGRIVGSITERGINRAYVESDLAKVRSSKVSAIMEDPFPILPANTPLVTVIGLLQQYQAVLVQERGLIMGIASNIDVVKVFQHRI